MYKGEYHHSLDPKGRLIVPSRLRDAAGDAAEFVVTCSFDGCLSMYAPREWEILEEKLNKLPLTNEKARKLKRFLLGSAVSCEVDKQGRMLIPQVLRERIGLFKEVVLVGVGDHIEIWEAGAWKESMDILLSSDAEDDMRDLGI